MELRETIGRRRSVRAYKPDSLPRELVEEILQAATQAPSNSNIQPWTFYVVTGKKKAELDALLMRCVEEGRPTSGELRESGEAGDEAELARLNSNRATLIRGVTQVLAENDLPVDLFTKGSFRFYGAPVAIVVTMDRSQGEGVVLAIGAAIENLLLAAVDRGLGGCWIALTVRYSKEIREFLGIPAGQRIITTVALGYPDENSPINSFKSGREPLLERIRWIE